MTLKDGRVLEKEAIGSAWSNGVSDEMLCEKFESLAKDSYDSDKIADIEKNAMAFNGNLTYFINALKSI